MEYISEYRDNSCQMKNSSKQWYNKTSKPCNYILHQFGGLHNLWDSPNLYLTYHKISVYHKSPE